MNILLCGTGSVAAIKFYKLYTELKEIGNVKGILTKSGEYFANKGDIKPGTDPASLADEIYKDEDEWKWEKVGDKVLHIDLRDWADILVIAPLSANTLAKMTYGLCDNLLTSVYRAWDYNKPIVAAPAMNTQMWENPLTGEQLNTLTDRHRQRPSDSAIAYSIRMSKFHIVSPISKALACGTTGMGAMAHTKDVVDAVYAMLNMKG